MKVVHILHELKFSGAEIMYVDAAPIFQSKSCELYVVATGKNLGEFAPNFKKAGYKIYHTPYPPLKSYIDRIKYYIHFFKFLKKEDIDIVHIHGLSTLWGMSLCAYLAKKKSMFTIHNVFSSRILTYPYHYLIRWTSKHIFKCTFQSISDSVYDNELKYYHNNTVKIYNWFSNKRYFPGDEAERKQIRNDLGISNETLIIISIGGCSPIKRHSEILKALALVLDKISNCHYLHLGKGISEEEEVILTKKLGLESNVHFIGNQADVRKYLIASDIYLMTSKFEGISLTTIEAMACQIPAILYDVPGLRDFNKMQETCVLIQEDFQKLAEEIILLSNDKSRSASLIKSAKKFVDQHYDMEINADKIFKLYCN